MSMQERQCFNNSRNRNIYFFARITTFNFYLFFSNATFAYDNLDRPSNKVSISKLYTRAFIAVIDCNFKPFSGKALCNSLSHRVYDIIPNRQRNYAYMRRCYRKWPNDAMFIIVLFNNSCHRARNTNAVATHQEWLISAIFSRIHRTHCARILIP